MFFYFVVFFFFASLTASTSNDYITIKYVTVNKVERPLFYSKHTGYFWSIGLNTFMDTGDNNRLKKFFKTKKEELGNRYDDFYKKLYIQQLKFIQSKGFNSIYTWSNLTFLDNKLPFGVLLFDDGAYTVITPLINYEGKSPPTGDGNEPCPIGDPYDEVYQKSLDSYVKKVVSPYKENTQVLTYWLGAEFGVGDTEPTDFSSYVYSKGVQRHLTKWLKDEYHEIKKLNEAWVSSFDSFEQAASTKSLTSVKYQKDIKMFSANVIRDWFKLVVKTIHKYDPNHLVSSPKLSVWDFESLDKAFSLGHFDSLKGLFDLVSVDWYSSKPVHSEQGYKDLKKLSLLLNVPVLVAEFGTRQRINGWTNSPGAKSIVNTQKERAERYRTQTVAIFNDPTFIGVGWFRWQDHINEKYQFNKGIIKVENGQIEPYTELMEAMGKVNKKINEDISLAR
ncbi:MAG: beta-galactosidase [bacterium]